MVAKLADGTPVNVGVYRAYRNAGLSHNQAMAITAEVGRENGFNPNILFNTHIDPAANRHGGSIRNVGMLSWNQGRDTQVLNYMKQAGVLGQQSQANLNAQAAFSVSEMKSGRYRSKLQNFWNNPNANPDSYARDLGKNYIVWAYGQNTIPAKGGGRTAFNWQAHDARRRGYLGTLASMLGDKGYKPQFSPQMQAQTPRPVAKSWAELTGQKQMPTPKPVAKSWEALTGGGQSVASIPKPVAKSWAELTGQKVG